MFQKRGMLVQLREVSISLFQICSFCIKPRELLLKRIRNCKTRLDASRTLCLLSHMLAIDMPTSQRHVFALSDVSKGDGTRKGTAFAFLRLGVEIEVGIDGPSGGPLIGDPSIRRATNKSLLVLPRRSRDSPRREESQTALCVCNSVGLYT